MTPEIYFSSFKHNISWIYSTVTVALNTWAVWWIVTNISKMSCLLIVASNFTNTSLNLSRHTLYVPSWTI